MTESPKSKKKVVRVESAAAGASSKTSAASDKGATNEPIWSSTPESKAQAGKLRIFAWVAWILAIGVEAAVIFWVLRQVNVNIWLLIGGIVLTGALAITGSMLWKQANRLDPAAKRDKVRFFVQNQLGAIMTIIAFLPMIILIFTNKNMDGKQKAVAGSIGVIVALVAVALGVSWNPPSQEQYAEEENIMMQLTGKDEVVWVKNGSVFHVCEDVPDVNRESQDGQIYIGTVAEAHAAGKDRLTSRWQSEAINHCGYTREQVEAVETGVAAPETTSQQSSVEAEGEQPDLDAEAPADEEAGEENETTQSE